ncbi:MAG: GreA/GreB family elongation factor [Fibrobacterales bacterium]
MKPDNHLSRAGFETLKAEWHDLKFVQRPEMKRQVQAAAAEGDRSENAAYTYGKMRLRDIDQRLKKLDRILDGSIIVDAVKSDDGKIRFGATATLLSKNTGKSSTYTLVGSAEVDAINGRISMDSPMGKELMFKVAGDTVTVNTPRGAVEYTVSEVEFL